MRLVVVFISLLLLLFLAACNTAEQNGELEEGSTKKEEQPTESHQEENKDLTSEETEVENESETNEEDSTIEEEIVTEKYRVSENWSIVPIEEGTNEKVVLLTIDDAPDKYALEMANTLKELEAGAIFFVNGHFLDTPEEQEVLKQIHDMGFLIGNHTYSHPYLPNSSEAEQQEEIIKLNDLIEQVIGERPAFFRAPNGANTEYTKQIASEEKMVLMNWSYGYDWEEEYRSKEKIIDIMLNSPYLGNGSNLLMHDREWTAAGLQDIVTGLREQGYEILDPHEIETIK
ncbi:polysaccharide deacetylase family protein [Ornithinibacillus xuwenensis]|uniref:Polysaccharide deacetylase family protein n=1 Tax=Ornithinibacillus xuwenensis TaxID=3144668 RepID=A0ABU9XEA9_9BACI